MAARGRPTPQLQSTASERPRFKDRSPEELRHADVNPFLLSHREYGRPLIPADQAWKLRDSWAEEFGREAPLHLEIGCGNGFFLSGLAERHPEINFLGIEIRYKRTVLTAKKLDGVGVSNARILRYHAAFLDDILPPGSLDAVYVNHPDPWPKERHEKNRLISRWFLEDLCSLLRPGGVFRLKSDHRPNVDRVAQLLSHDPDGEPAAKLPLCITGRSDDIITGPAPWPDDIETNYQSKFRKRGLPVYAIELQRD